MSTRQEVPRPIDSSTALATLGTGAFVLLILALMALPPVAVAQMYRWVDEQGEVHVTDDPNSVPKQLRSPAGQTPTATPAPAPPTATAPPAPPTAMPAPASRPGSTTSSPRYAPGGGGVALWLRTGGFRGEQEPVLIQVYDSEQTCLAERDRRTAVHVSQGMEPTSQPGLAMSNIGRTPAGDHYFAYRCVPVGIRPP
jgi:hypothetical protein